MNIIKGHIDVACNEIGCVKFVPYYCPIGKTECMDRDCIHDDTLQCTYNNGVVVGQNCYVMCEYGAFKAIREAETETGWCCGKPLNHGTCTVCGHEYWS